MIGLGTLVGLPVVIGGEKAGMVEMGVLTQSGDELLGLVIRKGLRGAKWLKKDQILSLGGVCVLAQGKPGRLPSQLPWGPGPVWDTCGLRLGRVTEVYLEGMRTAALEISLGPWEDWRFGRMVARTYTLIPQERGMKVLTPLDALLRKEEFDGSR